MAAKREIKWRFVAETNAFESAAKAVVGGLASVAAAGTAVVGALAYASSQALAAGGKFSDLSAKVGVSAVGLQKLEHAGRLVGVSVEQIGSGITKMQKSIVEGSTAFERLGLSAGKLRQQAPDKAFIEIAGAISRIKDPAGQAAAAIEVFGKAGAEMLPLLKSAIADVGEEAERLGLVLDEKTVAAADKLGDSFDTLQAAGNGLVTQLGGVIVSNNALHTAVGLAIEAVASMTKYVMDNRAALNDWVSSGVVFVVDGLGLLATAASRANETWTFLKLTWGAAKMVLADLGIAAATVTKSMMFDGDPEKAKLEADIELMKGFKAALGDQANQALTDYAKTQAAIDGLGAKAAAMADKVRAAAGATLDLGSAQRAAGPAIDFVSQKAAEQAQKMSDLQAKVKAYAAASIGGPQDLSNESLFKLTYTPEIVEAWSETAKLTSVTMDWREAIEGVGGAFGQLGQVAGGVLGGIFNLAGRLISTFQGVGKGLGSILSGGAAAGGLIGQVAGGSAGVGSGLGAIAGPLILKGIGSVLAPGIGTAVGAIAGGLLGKLFGGLFGGKPKEPPPPPPSWEEKWKTAIDAVGRFGVAAGASVAVLLASSGEAGNRKPEAQQFVNEQLGRSTGAMSAIGALDIKSEASAKAQATIFTTTFWAVVAEQGLVEGVDALAGPFEALKEKLSAGGFNVEALLGGVGGLFDAVQGPARASLEAMDALDQSLQGVALAGYMTRDSFAAYGQAAQDAVQQSISAGLAPAEALKAAGPLLADIVKTSQTYGLTLDSNTQALVDQAKAAGVAFPTGPMDRVVTVLEAIAHKLGAEIPEAAGQAASGIVATGDAGQVAADSISTSLGAVGVSVGDLGKAVSDTLGGTIPDVAGEAFGNVTSTIEAAMTEAATTTGTLAGQIVAYLQQISGTQVSIPVDFQFAAPEEGGPKPIPQAEGGTWAPRPGGHVVRVAEAGEAEDLVPASKRSAYARAVLGEGSGSGGISVHIGSVNVSGPEAAGREVIEVIKKALQTNAYELRTTARQATEGRR
jgi:hypothetical protein